MTSGGCPGTGLEDVNGASMVLACSPTSCSLRRIVSDTCQHPVPLFHRQGLPLPASRSLTSLLDRTSPLLQSLSPFATRHCVATCCPKAVLVRSVSFGTNPTEWKCTSHRPLVKTACHSGLLQHELPTSMLPDHVQFEMPFIPLMCLCFLLACADRSRCKMPLAEFAHVHP